MTFSIKGKSISERYEYARTHAKTVEEKATAFDQLKSEYKSDQERRIFNNIKDSHKRATLTFMTAMCGAILQLFATTLARSAENVVTGRRGNVKTGRSSGHGDGFYLPLDGKYYLVYGPCQSGKTTFIQNAGLAHVVFSGCSAITILRNSRGDAKQLEGRCKEFVKGHKAYMAKQGMAFNKKQSINYLYAGNTSESNLRKIQDALEGKTPSIIVAIANKFQLERLQEKIDKIDQPRYVVTIDEADQVVYGADAVKFRQILRETILEKAGRVYAVTATTFDLLFSEDQIRTSTVIRLQTRDYYKGLYQIQLRAIEKAVNPATDKEDWFKSDPHIVPLLRSLRDKNVYGDDLDCDEVRNEHHPIIMLFRNTHFNELQLALIKKMSETEDLGMWSGVVYNGHGIYIYSRYTRLLKRMGRTIGKPVPGFKGALFFKGREIDEGLQYMYDLNQKMVEKGLDPITHIAISSGDKADRGISFVSSNRKWHLSHMYYIPAGNTPTVSHDIQRIGRLCGNFHDAVPLKLYAPDDTLIDIIKGIRLQEEMFDRLAVHTDINMSRAIRKMKVSKYKVPGKDFCKHKATFKQVNGSDGGRSRKGYFKQIAKVKRIEEEVEIVEEKVEEKVEEVEEKVESGVVYTVVDQTLFGTTSKIYKMINDITAIIIETGKIGVDVRIDWVNKKLAKKYTTMTLDAIRGTVWTTIRRNKKMIRTTSKLANSFLYWKDSEGIKICITE